ncbi:MAG TPA: tetratricopeptide repeat protein [Kofleriaceae bacterium]|nr:tetratricopeptide repeat protein [Kofleriaceae bacterium]
MSRLPTVALVAIAAVVVGAGAGGCGNAAQVRHDRRWLKELTPPPLGVEHPLGGTPKIARIRVFADEDYRSQHVRWREEIQEQVDDANQLLIPAIGLQLEIAEIKPWAVRSAARELEDLEDQLEHEDPADDVAWVVGMVSSLPIVAAGFEQLGVARPLGRHFVLRGFADPEERKAFAQDLPTLEPAEREWLYDARRKHKLTALFVHELGHTLGAPHETDEGWVMNATYSTKMSTLSEQSRKLMETALDGWIAIPHEPASATAARVLKYVDENPWGGWNEDDLAQLHALLEQLATTPAGAGTGGATGDLPVPAAAFPQFQEAQALAQRGKYDDALAALEALIAAYPSAAELRIAVCQVTLAKDGAESPTAVAACDRALEVAPADPRPIFARVDALVAAHREADAVALLPRAEALAGDSPQAWEHIAAIYQSQTMISAAEAAIAHAHPAPNHPVLAWASRLRARYGLPPDGKKRVPAADEAAYVAAVRDILDLVYASKFPDAEAKARAAERRWPGTPGVLGARCDLALRRGSAAAAAALCDQAIKAWPGAAWAQYLRGVMELQHGKTKPAIVALRAAIAAEPELAQAYRTLGKALALAGDTAGHDALDAEYQQRFGARLPD